MAQVIAVLRNHSKKGRAWAMDALGSSHRSGHISSSEAAKYFKMAADKGNPLAMYNLARLSHDNAIVFRSTRNLAMAYRLLNEAVRAEPYLADIAYSKICRVAVDVLDRSSISEMSESLEVTLHALAPLADQGFGRAQLLLGLHYTNSRDPRSAMWYERLSVNISSPDYAYQAAGILEKHALLRVWYGVISKDAYVSPGHFPWVKKTLTKLRDKCASCGTGLDTSSRKLCKGCKAFCYCSVECQKAHWGAKDGGHRDECKKAMALEKEILMKKK